MSRSAFYYDLLDPGIREVVRLLRSHGFDTCDSGDGTKPEADGCTFGGAAPHVVCQVPPGRLCAEADRLRAVLVDLGVPVSAYDPEVIRAHIQASYDPCDGHALLILADLDDERLARWTGRTS